MLSKPKIVKDSYEMEDGIMRIEDDDEMEAVKDFAFSKKSKEKKSGVIRIFSSIASVFGSKKSKAMPESLKARRRASPVMDMDCMMIEDEAFNDEEGDEDLSGRNMSPI